MADEEKEKQEKLAAAKKRFEQLKKQQEKKGKKASGGKKKKEEVEKAKEDVEEAEEEVAKAQEDGNEEDDETGKGEDAVADGDADDVVKQSMQRSESFRKDAGGPSGEVQELYRKQSARIAELEKENKSLQSEHGISTARATKAEEELESAREANSDIDPLRQKAKDADKLQEELESTKRQLSQAQQKAGAGNRRQSTASPSDLSAQLTSKTAAIENLELEISKLRNQFESLERSSAEKNTASQGLADRVQAADDAAEAARQELEQLRVSIAFPIDDKNSEAADPEAMQKRISLLEHDVRTANTAADAASARASQLEDKITALTKLHREAAQASQNKDTELGTLREKLKRRDAGSHVRPGDTEDYEMGDDETETGALQKKIRELESENFDLRSGHWRERRAELQPGMEDGGYEDVDLNASTSGHRGSLPRQSSTFQDVLTSGINAFTGRQPGQGRHGPMSPKHDRKMSEGLLEDDEGEFDEGAWRQAQEEEAKKRVERVKEIKRGLGQWKGYKIDMRAIRVAGLPGREVGDVFEV